MTAVTYYQSGHVVLPSQLLFNYHHLFNNSEDFLVWQFCYLQNTTNLQDLLPSQIAQAIGKTVADVNRSFERLTEAGLLVIKIIDIAGEIETIFDTSPAFEKLDALLHQGQSKSADSVEALPLFDGSELKLLVDDFQRELGRLLSPFELEELDKLLKEVQTDPDLIREALKEAVFNGKTNWNYIQAILRNWRKEGILTVRQIEERRRERDRHKVEEVAIDEDFRLASNLWVD